MKEIKKEKEVKAKLEGVFKNLPYEIIDAVGGIENIDFSNSVHNYLKCGWSGNYDYDEWKLRLFNNNCFNKVKVDLWEDFSNRKYKRVSGYFIFSHKG